MCNKSNKMSQRAIVEFKDGTSEAVKVEMSYSKGGVHHYRLRLNKLKTFLDFEPGELKLCTEEEVKKLTYVMG